MGFLKNYKGVFFKKNGYINYTEVHRFMYGGSKGLAIFNPLKLAKNLNASHMDFQEWENSNIHYSDYGMLSFYTVKMMVLSGSTVQYGSEVSTWLISLL